MDIGTEAVVDKIRMVAGGIRYYLEYNGETTLDTSHSYQNDTKTWSATHNIKEIKTCKWVTESDKKNGTYLEPSISFICSTSDVREDSKHHLWSGKSAFLRTKELCDIQSRYNYGKHLHYAFNENNDSKWFLRWAKSPRKKSDPATAIERPQFEMTELSYLNAQGRRIVTVKNLDKFKNIATTNNSQSHSQESEPETFSIGDKVVNCTSQRGGNFITRCVKYFKTSYYRKGDLGIVLAKTRESGDEKTRYIVMWLKKKRSGLKARKITIREEDHLKSLDDLIELQFGNDRDQSFLHYWKRDEKKRLANLWENCGDENNAKTKAQQIKNTPYTPYYGRRLIRLALAMQNGNA